MDDTTSSEQSRAAVDPGDQPLNPDEEIVEIEKLLAAEPDDFQARCRRVNHARAGLPSRRVP